MRAAGMCKFLLVVLPHAFNLSCSDTGASALVTEIGKPDEVRLALGESILLVPEQINLQFHRIAEDSRCPSNAICVWAGRAIIQLHLVGDRSGSATIHLLLPGMIQEPYDSPSTDTLGYRFVLRQLNPYPSLERPQAQRQEALIRIEKIP